MMAVLADHLGVKLALLGRQIWDGPDDDPFGRLVGLLPLQQHALEWALGGADVGRGQGAHAAVRRGPPNQSTGRLRGVRLGSPT